jgi:hypothetical protein
MRVAHGNIGWFKNGPRSQEAQRSNKTEPHWSDSSMKLEPKVTQSVSSTTVPAGDASSKAKTIVILNRPKQ